MRADDAVGRLEGADLALHHALASPTEDLVVPDAEVLDEELRLVGELHLPVGLVKILLQAGVDLLEILVLPWRTATGTYRTARTASARGLQKDLVLGKTDDGLGHGA